MFHIQAILDLKKSSIAKRQVFSYTKTTTNIYTIQIQLRHIFYLVQTSISSRFAFHLKILLPSKWHPLAQCPWWFFHKLSKLSTLFHTIRQTTLYLQFLHCHLFFLINLFVLLIIFILLAAHSHKLANLVWRRYCWLHSCRLSFRTFLPSIGFLISSFSFLFNLNLGVEAYIWQHLVERKCFLKFKNVLKLFWNFRNV